MNIDDDILHIARSLFDQIGGNEEKFQSTVYSFYDRKRIESKPYYKNDNSISKMVELGLIKIKHIDFNSQPIDTSTIYRYFFYNVEFLPKQLKDYLKKQKGKTHVWVDDEIVNIDTLPICVEEKRKGYLKFNKYGQKIFIGDVTSRHYRFLKYMLDPMLIKTQRAIETIFEEIRLLKDETEYELSKHYGNNARKLELIQYCIKELQKDKKLQGKIRFEFNPQNTHIKTIILS